MPRLFPIRDPPPLPPPPEGEARPVPPIRKREFIMTLYFPENTYYELPFKEVVYYAFHGRSCVSRQPREGGGEEEEEEEWEEGVFLLFFFSRIKIPVIRHFAIFSCFSRILGSKRVDRFWIGSFRLSFSSVDRFWKFCLYPYAWI